MCPVTIQYVSLAILYVYTHGQPPYSPPLDPLGFLSTTVRQINVVQEQLPLSGSYSATIHAQSTHKTAFVRDPAPLCQGREMVPVTDHHVCTASQYMQYQTGMLGSCPPCLNAC